MTHILQGYADAAPELIVRYRAISSAEVFHPVLDLLPITPVRVMDVGAGTGRDAAWLAGMGHHVLAIEPVSAFREAGMAAFPLANIRWLDDSLPELTRANGLGPFDLLLLCAVWQHLDDMQRGVAIDNLAKMAAPGATLMMSLRHGPGVPGRPVHPIDPAQTVGLAEKHGFRLIRRQANESVDPVHRVEGIHWTWLVFSRS